MIPRILLGTSPFIGAGQFGERAYTYFVRFYNNPEEIARIIDTCWKIGVKGIQLLPEGYIIDAVRKWEKITGNKIVVIPSVFSIDDIGRLSGLNVPAVLLHAMHTDRLDKGSVEGFISSVKDLGLKAGLVTHTPYRTLRWVREESIDVDIMMLPINRTGYMMDSSLEQIRDVLADIGCYVIAKKILAAGRIPVREALEFVSKLDFVDSVAIGVASVEEAKETFSIAIEVLQK